MRTEWLHTAVGDLQVDDDSVKKNTVCVKWYSVKEVSREKVKICLLIWTKSNSSRYTVAEMQGAAAPRNVLKAS